MAQGARRERGITRKTKIEHQKRNSNREMLIMSEKFTPLPIATTAMGIKQQGVMKRQFIETLKSKKRPEHEIDLRGKELHELQSAYSWLKSIIEKQGG